MIRLGKQPEERLNNAIIDAAARGDQLKPGWWAESGHVCLCGAVLRAVGDENTLENQDGDAIIRRVAKVLHITVAQAGALNNGFEGAPRTRLEAKGATEIRWSQTDEKWYTIGKAIRRRWERYAD